MDWVDKLERRFGHLAIPQLVNGLLVGQLMAGLVVLLFNRNFASYIFLSRAALLHGQVWRLVTFLFQPIWLGGVFGILNLLFYFWIGNALTRLWGDFRMTVFLVLGMLGAWASCLLVGYATPDAIFMSMLFAYTWLWPEQTALLFGVIPFKMKYLGWLELFFWAVNFLTGSLAVKVSLVLGLAGFLAFYGKELVSWCKDTASAQKRRRDWENRNR